MHDSGFDLAELWLSSAVAAGRSPATIKTYEQALRSLREWRTMREHGLETLTKLEARAWVRWMLDQYTPGGVAFRLRSIKPFYSWLVAEQEIEVSPFKGIHVAVPERIQTTADELEIEAMLVRAKGKPRDLALLTVLADTGCRKGEIAALEWQHIDIHNRLITFPVSKTRPRIVPMTERCYAALVRWGRRRGVGPGSLWNVTMPYALVERLVRYYSRGKLGPHAMRRAFAIRYIAAGGSESAAMRLLGWRGSEMVRVYIAARSDELAHSEFRRLLG